MATLCNNNNNNNNGHIEAKSKTMPGELIPEAGGGVGEETSVWIPTVDIGSWKGQDSRLAKVTTQFINAFQEKPTFFVRVPGRVNLIGEHVDYCGYAVFPMAIEQDVLLAGSTSKKDSSSSLSLINTTPTLYPRYEGLLKDVRAELEEREVGKSPPWHLYFLCGVLGVQEHLGLGHGVGMRICVDGRVPPRAGLSSSSALVCAAALGTMVANGGSNTTIGKGEMASLCAKSERYIGTQGGGMDQAIAFLASPGTAQKIDFIPALNGEKVSLPPSAVFVIANSLVEANKAAGDGYNVRVAECRLATWITAKKAGLPNYTSFEKVKQLQLSLGCSIQELLGLVESALHEEPYTAAEVGGKDFGRGLERLRIPLQDLQLKLFQRITHVLQEAGRVEEFYAVCKGDKSSDTLSKLGALMNGSHQSLKELYECSHPQLDVLVGLAQSRSHGARLTGAGWGGCMVALCDESQVPQFLNTLKKEYYAKMEPKQQDEGIENHVFVTQPGGGATILRPSL